MARLGDVTAELARLGRRWRELTSREAGRRHGPASGERNDGPLRPVAGFGSNPGELEMLVYAPPDLPPSPALVLVLHGCTQTAAGYDQGAGWSTLADRYGFVVVYGQQTARNNAKTCFNWFLPGDTTRGQGEALSLRQMVERAALDHGVDRRRVFVTGLSAGGAMAAVMLATYPDVFAAGGIVAGLPYGSATTVQGALQAMFQTGRRPAREWGDLVRGASPRQAHGRWPRISIWHGGSDAVVKPVNAEELVKQWTDVHGLPETPSAREMVDGHAREVWRDAQGVELLESFMIAGMGHGTPLQVGEGDDMAGAAGAYLLDVGISSSYHMAKFWGLAGPGAARPSRPRPKEEVGALPRAEAAARRRTAKPGADIGGVINDALRAAGLLKG